MANGPTFKYSVDGDERTTSEHQLTAREILKEAGFNPDDRFLVEVKGKNQESYQNRLDEQIHMHANQKFITVFIGTVPVS